MVTAVLRCLLQQLPLDMLCDDDSEASMGNLGSRNKVVMRFQQDLNKAAS